MQVRGFSLVEVLIASLIIMLGVSGVVSLQSAYMRSDAQTSNRHAALRLAQNKFDDLRQFEAIESAAGIIAYNDIADNTGGTIKPGQVDVTLGTDGEFHSFTRNWEVEDQYFSDTTGDGVADTWMDRVTLLGRGLPLPPFPAQSEQILTLPVLLTMTLKSCSALVSVTEPAYPCASPRGGEKRDWLLLANVEAASSTNRNSSYEVTFSTPSIVQLRGLWQSQVVWSVIPMHQY